MRPSVGKRRNLDNPLGITENINAINGLLSFPGCSGVADVAGGRSHCEPSYTAFNTPLSRAERTGEDLAVSGVYRESRGELMTLPGIPRTNLTQASTAVLTETPGTPQKLTIHDAIRYYLDCIAQVATPEANLATKLFSPKCGQWFKIGRCKNGHRIAVPSNCRKPYCEICGLVDRLQGSLTLYLEPAQLPSWLTWRFLSRHIRARAAINTKRKLHTPPGLLIDPTLSYFQCNHLIVSPGRLLPYACLKERTEQPGDLFISSPLYSWQQGKPSPWAGE